MMRHLNRQRTPIQQLMVIDPGDGAAGHVANHISACTFW